MDRRAVAVGAVLCVAAVLGTWYGRLPMGLFLTVFVGPAVAGFLSESRESKAFDGVAAMGGGLALSLVGLIVINFLTFTALPLVWRVDAAFTTLVVGLVLALFFVPICCVGGAVCAGAGGLLRDVVDGLVAP